MRGPRAGNQYTINAAAMHRDMTERHQRDPRKAEQFERPRGAVLVVQLRRETMKAYVYIANFGDRKAQHELVETLDEVAPAYTATVMHNGNVLVDCRVEDLGDLLRSAGIQPQDGLDRVQRPVRLGLINRGLRPPPFQQGESKCPALQQ
jgi:ribosome-binding ATPase YchF (GTP1/OBG family)